MHEIRIDQDICLHLLEESLADDLFALVDFNREYLSKWLPWLPSTKTVEDTRSFIKASIQGYSAGKTMVLGIFFHEIIVGVISFNHIQPSLKKVDIGYWLAASHQGKGIVTRACRAMIRYAFEELDMQKVEIAAAAGNLGSRKICERLGLTLEGIITNAENLNGQIVDHVVYGIHAEKP